jgi:hypothetical protein
MALPTETAVPPSSTRDVLTTLVAAVAAMRFPRQHLITGNRMHRTSITIGALLLMFAASAGATDTDDLIALDKQWGESGIKGDPAVATMLLSDKVVSVTENGVRGKQGELADMEPASAGTRYEATDYKVTFVNPDTAIMTHGTKGTEAHYSLHVLSRDKGGKWQVVATSTTPAATTKK